MKKQLKENKMSVAKQFLEELRAGNIDGAIEQIKEGLRQDAYQKIEESRQEILESYGFVLNEQTFYAIKDTKTNKVISTHDNEADAKDEAEGLGGGVKVVKTKKAPKGWSMKENKEEEKDRSKLNEAYEVEVAVSDARKAYDIAKDMFRGEYKNEGSNVYIFKKEGIKDDFIAELDKQGIEYSEDE